MSCAARENTETPSSEAFNLSNHLDSASLYNNFWKKNFANLYPQPPLLTTTHISYYQVRWEKGGMGWEAVSFHKHIDGTQNGINGFGTESQLAILCGTLEGNSAFLLVSQFWQFYNILSVKNHCYFSAATEEPPIEVRILNSSFTNKCDKIQTISIPNNDKCYQ